jgi:putative oxidoreductase
VSTAALAPSAEHDLSWLKKLAKTDAGWAITSVRVALGVVMLPHGAQKALGTFGGGGITGTIEFFENVFHTPAPVTLLVIAAEFLGSIGLIVGLGTRVAAASIGAVMLGAIFIAHAHVGFFMDWGGTLSGEGFEYHLLAIGMAIALVIAGGGRASVDGRLAR